MQNNENAAPATDLAARRSLWQIVLQGYGTKLIRTCLFVPLKASGKYIGKVDLLHMQNVHWQNVK